MRKMIQHANETNSQLCVTGNAFNKLFEGKVEEISQIKREFLDHATVFARTKPHDKAKIVMVYQHTGRTVSMCGDGANDCGALKQADIGLSLAQTEASMSAPFTSQITNISSMVELIKECRAGLATNFSLFNIMASYSLTQYTTSIVDQIFYSYPADFHYLYWDIACNFFFIVVFGFTGTADKLSVAIPNNSLFCFTNLFQILFYFGINVLGQISMIMALSGIFNSTISY
jgi:cation-transporting ATPase 13A2